MKSLVKPFVVRRQIAHVFKLVCIISLAMAKLGCSENLGQQKIDTYAERLANVLESYEVKLTDNDSATGSGDTQSQEASSTQFKYPDKKKIVRAHNLPESKIDLLDFLSLYGCRLQGVVAEANSSLGKVAHDSQRLINALQFLQHAPACLKKLKQENETTLADQLQAEFERKRKLLPYLIARATIGSDEFRSFWNVPNELEDYPEIQSLEPLQAVGRFAELSALWQTGAYEQGQSEVEDLLSQIRLGDGGSLLKAFGLLERELSALNLFLDRVLMSERLCRHPELYSVPILRNVVQTFFAEGVQVWAAQLNRRHYAIEHAMVPLEQGLGDQASESYNDWKRQRDLLFGRVKQQVQNHVLKLQVLLEDSRLKQHCMERIG